MADYKLKLEIDAAELQKQLETAFKKGIKLAGGGAGGSSGAFDYSKTHSKNMQKLDNQNYKLSLKQKKELEKHTYTLKTEYAKQKTLLRAQNIMLEKSGVQQARTFKMIGGLVGGRMGSAGGAGMDQVITILSAQKKRRGQVKDAQQAYDDMAALPGAKMGPRPEQESNTYNKLADIGGRIKDSPIGSFLGTTKKTFEDKVPGAKQAGGIAGKVGSKIPQAVKLAGVGAALAGGAGLAKMIIDSSPMLKSMLKLLNVGIMLILRPIGDFIGFMLRPLLVEFVKKVAVPAYKKGAVWAKEWGDKAGKALLGFFNDPIGTISMAIQDGMQYVGALIDHALRSTFNVLGTYKEGDEHFDRNKAILEPDKDEELKEDTFQSEMDEFMADPWSTNPKLDATTKAVQDMQPWLQTETSLLCGVVGNTATTNELLESMPEKIAAAQVEAAAKQAADALQQQEAEMEKQRQAEKDRQAAIEAEEKRIFEEQFEKPFAPAEPDYHLIPKGGLSETAQKIIDKFEAWKRGESWAGGAAQAGGREGTTVNPLGTCQMGGMTGTGEFKKYEMECGSTGSSEIFEYENFAADSRAQMEAYSKAIEESTKTGNSIKEEYNKIMVQTAEAMQNQKLASQNYSLIKESTWEVKTNVQLMTDATKNMSDNLNATAKYVASLLNRAYSVRKPSGERKYPWAGEQADGLDSAFGGSSSKTAVEREKYRITLVNGSSIEQVLDPTSYKYFMNLRNTGKAFRGSLINSIQKMAAGGLITEPIFGIGQNTGKGYLMGEAGPERVTPGTGPANGSGGNTFNITINATGIGDIERQLKPALLRMLKESTSRAGIV